MKLDNFLKVFATNDRLREFPGFDNFYEQCLTFLRKSHAGIQKSSLDCVLNINKTSLSNLNEVLKKFIKDDAYKTAIMDFNVEKITANLKKEER